MLCNEMVGWGVRKGKGEFFLKNIDFLQMNNLIIKPFQIFLPLTSERYYL